LLFNLIGFLIGVKVFSEFGTFVKNSLVASPKEFYQKFLTFEVLKLIARKLYRLKIGKKCEVDLPVTLNAGLNALKDRTILKTDEGTLELFGELSEL